MPLSKEKSSIRVESETTTNKSTWHTHNLNLTDLYETSETRRKEVETEDGEVSSKAKKLFIFAFSVCMCY